MSRFKRGQSGNPSGRPKGSKDKRTALRALLEPHAEKLVEKAVALALEGDSTALRLCIDRIIPAYRSVDIPVSISLDGGTLTQKAEGILAQMAAGTLTPSESAAVVQALSGVLKVKELEDLEDRVTKLEKRAK